MDDGMVAQQCECTLKNSKIGLASVAHAYNLGYSGGRDQEDCSLKPTWANSSPDPISKNSITRKKKKHW
jgi:hypothetical protein